MSSDSLDPFEYRWVTLIGVLKTQTEDVRIAEGMHANDLPPGEAGKDETIERVRKHYAYLYKDPEALWVEVQVFEQPPENGFFDLRFPFDPPELG